MTPLAGKNVVLSQDEIEGNGFIMIKPWGPKEKAHWLAQQRVKRSYRDEVVARINTQAPAFQVSQYGVLTYESTSYPLFFIQTKNVDSTKRTVLITGGVHGYETSGVHGALDFMENEAHRFSEDFNIICFPCLSPWGYETINRWNPLAIDPNRSFFEESPAEECKQFLSAITSLKVEIFAHFDLHETTDTDNTIFRPALAARDGKEEGAWSEIPDGFYLVGDVSRPEREFQKAIIRAVNEVTHIAPPDHENKIIGVTLDQEGVIYYDMKKLFLCGGFSKAIYTTTTEVYPDSPRATAAICNRAQVVAISSGLDFIKSKLSK